VPRQDKFSVSSFQFPEKDRGPIGRTGAAPDGVTLNVSTVDAKSFERYMKQNRGGLIRQLKGLGRDFAFNS
jgi:hypothetical protein